MGFNVSICFNEGPTLYYFPVSRIGFILAYSSSKDQNLQCSIWNLLEVWKYSCASTQNPYSYTLQTYWKTTYFPWTAVLPTIIWIMCFLICMFYSGIGPLKTRNKSFSLHWHSAWRWIITKKLPTQAQKPLHYPTESASYNLKSHFWICSSTCDAPKN